ADVAFVNGRRCKDVAEADALDVIAGYTLLNDLSARDYQFMTPQWMPGKVFDGSAPCGPAIVTPDEAGPHDGIEISLTLNGEEMQSASTADLIHSIPAVVAYLSKLMTLQAGDLISTGTPAGVGSVRQPHVWLKPGDECVIESLSTSSGQSLSGPSAVLKPSWSSTASQSSSTTSESSSEWNSVIRSIRPFPLTSRIW